MEHCVHVCMCMWCVTQSIVPRNIYCSCELFHILVTWSKWSIWYILSSKDEWMSHSYSGPEGLCHDFQFGNYWFLICRFPVTKLNFLCYLFPICIFIISKSMISNLDISRYQIENFWFPIITKLKFLISLPNWKLVMTNTCTSIPHILGWAGRWRLVLFAA